MNQHEQHTNHSNNHLNRQPQAFDQTDQQHVRSQFETAPDDHQHVQYQHQHRQQQHVNQHHELIGQTTPNPSYGQVSEQQQQSNDLDELQGHHYETSIQHHATEQQDQRQMPELDDVDPHLINAAQTNDQYVQQPQQNPFHNLDLNQQQQQHHSIELGNHQYGHQNHHNQHHNQHPMQQHQDQQFGDCLEQDQHGHAHNHQHHLGNHHHQLHQHLIEQHHLQLQQQQQQHHMHQHQHNYGHNQLSHHHSPNQHYHLTNHNQGQQLQLHQQHQTAQASLPVEDINTVAPVEVERTTTTTAIISQTTLYKTESPSAYISAYPLTASAHRSSSVVAELATNNSDSHDQHNHSQAPQPPNPHHPHPHHLHHPFNHHHHHYVTTPTSQSLYHQQLENGLDNSKSAVNSGIQDEDQLTRSCLDAGSMLTFAQQTTTTSIKAPQPLRRRIRRSNRQQKTSLDNGNQQQQHQHHQFSTRRQSNINNSSAATALHLASDIHNRSTQVEGSSSTHGNVCARLTAKQLRRSIHVNAIYKDSDIEHNDTHIIVSHPGSQSPVVMTNEELISLQVRHLNKKLAGFPKPIVNKVKQRRRTLKNRGYAQSCRQKRLNQRNLLEGENEKLKQELRQLMDKIRSLEKDANLQNDSNNSKIQ